MAKKANLLSALDAVTPPPVAPVQREAKAAPVSTRVGTALVGAHLPIRYQKALKLLSAETDKSQRDLLKEALDMLFVAKGVRLEA